MQAPTSRKVATLLAMAEELGVSVEELAAAAANTGSPSQVTVANFLPAVDAATSEGARLTYRPYWRRLVTAMGDRHLAAIRTSELRSFVLATKEHAKKRANSRHGVSAQENCVGALRAFFRLALEDGYITRNPMEGIDKPSRLPSRRRFFTDVEVAEIYEVTANGGDDPVLDTLLLRFHLETGARRGGALGLRLRDLDHGRQCLRLREKNQTERWQPVSRTLLDALAQHAACRGARDPEDQVFRRLPRRDATVGVPITRRRYNTLVARWGRSIPWVRELGVSIHWCRHHATSCVERIAGFAVARAFAGHREGREVTLTYTSASFQEVCRAVAIYTGEPHPGAG
jgi:integrase/recombinase XerC